MIRGRRHHPSRPGVPEHTLNRQMPGKGRASTCFHGKVSDLDCRFDRSQPGLQYKRNRRI
jgi:hypothetical protein